MALTIDVAVNVRKQLLVRNAGQGKTAGSYYDKVYENLQQSMESGATAASSSGIGLLKKITGEATIKDMNQIKHLLQKEGTQKASVKQLSEKLSALLLATKALSAQTTGSAFVKNRPTDKTVNDYFDITCSKDGPSFSLDVKQLAKAQENEGAELSLSQKTAFAGGRRYFDLTVDGKTSSLVVKIEAEDTNQSVLQKVVNVINNANAGVTASVEKKDGDTGYVKITCNGTGAPLQDDKDVFHFTDFSNDGFVEALQLNHMTQQGQDAIFNFNHAQEDTTYMYNEAEIDGSVHLAFKKVTEGAMDFSFEYDQDALCDKIRSYVEAFNEAKHAIKTGGYEALKNYLSKVIDVTKGKAEALTNMGITMDSDGEMHFNEGLFYNTSMTELKKTWNAEKDGYAVMVEDNLTKMSAYMDRLSGKTKKYYGLKAKKSNAALREKLNQQKQGQ